MLSGHYKLLVIGAGSGGMACARRAAKFTEGVAIVEHKKPGGTCVNLGCIPKKILWQLGVLKKELGFFKEAGLLEEGPLFADWETIRTKKQAYIHKLNDLYLENLAKDKVEFIKGFAEFLDPHTLRVGDRTVTAEKVVIAVGSKPKRPDIPGAELGITSDDYFHLTKLPKSMVIVGSGYIGLELACSLLDFGVKIDLVMNKPFVLQRQDHESSDYVLECLEKRGGITIHRNALVTSLEQKEGKGLITTTLKDGKTLQAETVLFAVGREPLTHNLGLEKVEVKLGEKKEIEVDEVFRTNIKDIFALGDCIGKVQLTPVAIREGRVLAERLFNPDQPDYKVDYENIPTVVFADPPYASCGLTEEEAVKRFGKEDVEVYKTSFKDLHFALFNETRKERTYFKMIGIKSQDKKIVGVHLVGKSVDEMIQLAAVLIKMGATKKQVDAAIAVHPSAAEELVLLQPHFL